MTLFRQTTRFLLNGERFLGITAAARCMSTQSRPKLLTVTQDEYFDDVAVLKMVKKPDNLICTNLLNELSETLQDVEETDSYRAMVLTSGVSGVFSAGLDILSLRQKPSNEIYKFWSLYQEIWVRLFGSSLITVAAINGSATAVGCALTTACDSRIMVAGDSLIGHNETSTGWLVPYWVKIGMEKLIGFKNTERSFLKGTLFTPDEALKIGLVDKVVPESELMTSVRDRLKESASLEDYIRISTKQTMRQDIVDHLKRRRDEDVTNMTIYSLMEKEQLEYI